jgi:LysR family transcriptional regulator, cyn operon transcriptional activator
MELRELEYFVKTAELLNFSQAAAAFSINQSTLWRQIRQLEEKLNQSLFDRRGKYVQLTEAGLTLLPYARQTVLASEQGRKALDDLMDVKTGVLHIGVAHDLTMFLTQAIVRFTAAYPDISIQVVFGTSEALQERMQLGQLDLMLSYTYISRSKTAQPLFTSYLSLILKREHEFAVKKHVSPRRLAELPLILPNKNHNVRSFLDEVLQRDDVNVDIKMDLDDINTILQLVSAGSWCTVLIAATATSAAWPNLTAIPLKGEEMRRQATASWSESIYQKKSAVLFTDLLVQLGRELC